MNRFDYTRIKTFQMCPKKHDYIYNQEIKGEGNFKMRVGTLFHAALDAHYCDEEEKLDKVFKDFRALVSDTSEDVELDLLEYVFTKYLHYYVTSDSDEEILASEQEIIDEIDPDNEFYLRLDRLIHKKSTGQIILRDTKTTLNKLKYTYEDVAYNQQLLTYVPFIEAKTGLKIDAVEIDEVRLCKLQPVPLNANGKPTADKGRLEFTTLEDYEDTLHSMGLYGDKAYANALEYLAKRGHPMFNRINAQILDPSIVQSNLNDTYDTYSSIQKADSKFRNKGPLCKSCEYYSLCKLDMLDPESPIREVEVNKIIG